MEETKYRRRKLHTTRRQYSVIPRTNANTCGVSHDRIPDKPDGSYGGRAVKIVAESFLQKAGYSDLNAPPIVHADSGCS
jgi:hypothetical protein